MRHCFATIAGTVFFLGAGPALCAPAERGVAVSPTQGDHLNSIFAKTTAITGTDFDPYIRRVSGSADDSVTRAGATEFEEEENYNYDGVTQGKDKVLVRDGGRTNCVDGKCALNRSTSAPTFNPSLWGEVPARLHVGASWRVAIDKPWEIGPAGDERVTVSRWVPGLKLLTMVRTGSGEGASEDDQRSPHITITNNGTPVQVKVVPGTAHWEGKATFLRGITIADEIVLNREVTLVADDGRVFHGSERIYTLFQEA